jgi:hypothetical protein
LASAYFSLSLAVLPAEQAVLWGELIGTYDQMTDAQVSKEKKTRASFGSDRRYFHKK